jgi:acyl-homoserine lactone acylase PvdQ
MEERPNAPTTTTKRFPYPEPRRVAPGAVAQPDAGSMKPVEPIEETGGGSSQAGGVLPTGPFKGLRRLGASRLGRGGGESYAVLVSGSKSKSGRPIADMGPQVNFFSPEILYEEDLRIGDRVMRGAALPGALPFPIVGHTDRYAWSVTIGVGDHIDSYAERLCNPDGSPPTASSDHYLHKGVCTEFLKRSRTFTTTTNAINTGPPQTYTVKTLRSVHGPIQAFATVKGVPVAIARADTTYNRLADISVAYDRLAQGAATGARSFIKTVRGSPFSLNWFYADKRDIAWTLSGRYPKRATVKRAGQASALPAWGTGRWDWRGAISATKFPQVVNPKRGYIANWNNKPAPGWRAADDDFYYGPVHRVQLYNKRLRRVLAGARKLDEAALVGLVEDANLVDVRGALVLPQMLKVIGAKAGDPGTQRLVALLRAWVASGAHRQDMDGDGNDDAAAAARLMDAWWPRAVQKVFTPVMGKAAYARAIAITPVDDPPPVEAEAFYWGWYGQLQQDLRDALKKRSGGHFSRVYCGSGKGRAACRTVLLTSLRSAAAAVATAQGSDDPANWKLPTTCPVPASGHPDCDEIVFAPTGAIETPPVPWQNRPTYQQVVAFP